MKLVECVPNFSEGRRKEVVEAIVREVREVEGCFLLDYSMDPDHNRAVVTFSGEPEPVKEAAFRTCKKAVELINMEKHRGQHPRIGACDVVPFIPLNGITMRECVEISQEVARRIWEELQVPTYLYGESARSPGRKCLPDIRRGEYEGLKKAVALPERQPDFGEPRLHPTAGATAVGARDILIAFNVNLNTSDLSIAQKIARALRESSGGLAKVQARGMMMSSRGFAQVSMNLLNFHVTSIFDVFQAVKSEAEKLGVTVSSSEIVGLLPIAALIDTFSRFLKIEGVTRDNVLEMKLWKSGVPYFPE